MLFYCPAPFMAPIVIQLSSGLHIVLFWIGLKFYVGQDELHGHDEWGVWIIAHGGLVLTWNNKEHYQWQFRWRTNGLEDRTQVIRITFMVFFVLSGAWQTYSQCLWAATNLISWQKDWYGLQKQHRIRPELRWRTRTCCAFICCRTKKNDLNIWELKLGHTWDH